MFGIGTCHLFLFVTGFRDMLVAYYASYLYADTGAEEPGLLYHVAPVAVAATVEAVAPSGAAVQSEVALGPQ